MDNSPYILVIGGTNMDVGARPFGPLLPHDSLPGTVRRTPGGVGRNIAVTLAQLGHKVKMLTAVGNDADGRELLALGREIGLDLSHAMVLDGIPTSSYIFVEDNKGDIQWAVCDASASDQIDAEYISLNAELIRGAAAVLLDTNPPVNAIACAAKIASEAGVPLFVDPISAAKASKIKKILPYITVLKPNKMEAETLSGRPILTMADAEEAVIALLGMGVQQVFLTLGKKGVVVGAQGQEIQRLPGFALHPVNTSGCGDAFVSAVIHAFLQGDDLKDMARAGVAAASISMETKSAVNPILTAEALSERLKLV
ncbi:MAG: carbohydrate kinase family protein [Lachnospiraceae bacterium]|nr:carbohydrate kinase family protein [Lachnospiraceae bacterium]MBQ6197555.1 carbohydrate kinase family protein [Lachnospiraceae bacterium]